MSAPTCPIILYEQVRDNNITVIISLKLITNFAEHIVDLLHFTLRLREAKNLLMVIVAAQ